MIRAAQAATALYGALRLARFDASGLTFFDTSVRGYWQSFFAAALVAPLYVVLVMLRMSVVDVGLDAVIIDFLAYGVSWLAFPVLMINLSASLDRRQHYRRHIVAYNWAAVLQNAIYLPVAMLILTGALPPEVGAFISVMVLGWVLVYSGYLTHVALDVPLSSAAGLVAVDFMLGLFINGMAASTWR